MAKVVNYQMKCTFDGYSDFEIQVQEQCKLFYKETKKYPTSIVQNKITYDIWSDVMAGNYDAKNESPRKKYYWNPDDPECYCFVGEGKYIYGTKISLTTYILNQLPIGTYILRYGNAPIFDGEDFEEEEQYLMAA